MEIGTLGTMQVNLYVPGTVVRIGGITDIQAKTGTYLNDYVITQVLVFWDEPDTLDIKDGFVQTLRLLAISADGDDLGIETILVETDKYDIEIV